MNTIIAILVYILEGIFVLGLIGSAIVLILTTIEDAKSLTGDDKHAEAERPGGKSSLEHATQV